MESLPAIDCSIVCELFINDLLGILANSTATHMVHFCMSLLVSCIYTFVLVLPVWNLPLKHCWISYDVIKLQTVEYKTCISDKYMPNTFNGSHNSILKKLPEYSIISFNTFKFVKFTWSHSHAHSVNILINLKYKRVCFPIIILNHNNCLLQHRHEVSTLLPFAIKLGGLNHS